MRYISIFFHFVFVASTVPSLYNVARHHPLPVILRILWFSLCLITLPHVCDKGRKLWAPSIWMHIGTLWKTPCPGTLIRRIWHVRMYGSSVTLSELNILIHAIYCFGHILLTEELLAIRVNGVVWPVNDSGRHGVCRHIEMALQEGTPSYVIRAEGPGEDILSIDVINMHCYAFQVVGFGHIDHWVEMVVESIYAKMCWVWVTWCELHNIINCSFVKKGLGTS